MDNLAKEERAWEAGHALCYPVGMKRDPMRELLYSRVWNQITTSLPADKAEAAAELASKAASAGLVEIDAEMTGEDDCIVIWPSRGLVGTTSVFPRLHDLLHRLEMVDVTVQSAERRLAEAEEKYRQLPRSVAPDYRN